MSNSRCAPPIQRPRTKSRPETNVAPYVSLRRHWIAMVLAFLGNCRNGVTSATCNHPTRASVAKIRICDCRNRVISSCLSRDLLVDDEVFARAR